MTGSPSIVFTRNANVDKTFIRTSNNTCKTIVRIEAGQLYPFAMCQVMTTGLYTRWELKKFSKSSKLVRTRLENLKTWLFLTIKQSDQTVLLRASIQLENRKKLIGLMLMTFVDTAIQFPKLSDVTTISVPVEKLNTLIAKKNFNMVSRSENPISYKKKHPEKRGYKIIEMRECEWWDQVQMSSFLKNHVRKKFLYKHCNPVEANR